MSKGRERAADAKYLEEQLALLQRISRLTARDTPLEEALRQFVSLVTRFMGCDSCLLYVREGDQLVLRANTSGWLGERPIMLAMNEGLTGWVAHEKRLLAISREAYHDPRFRHFSELPEDTYEAFLSVPMIARGIVAGVINVQHRLPHAHSGGEMEMLTTVGEQVGCLLVLAQPAKGIEPIAMPMPVTQ